MLKRFLRAWVLEPTRRYQRRCVVRCGLWRGGSGLPCRQAARRWLRLLHGGLALFFGAMALVNTGIAFYYA